MILQDNPGDPTLECVEVHPDELTHWLRVLME